MAVEEPPEPPDTSTNNTATTDTTSSTLTGGASGSSTGAIKNSSSTTTSASGQGRRKETVTVAQGQDSKTSPFIKRSYAQIIAEAEETAKNSQTIILKLNKEYNPENSQFRPPNLDQEK